MRTKILTGARGQDATNGGRHDRGTNPQERKWRESGVAKELSPMFGEGASRPHNQVLRDEVERRKARLGSTSSLESGEGKSYLIQESRLPELEKTSKTLCPLLFSPLFASPFSLVFFFFTSPIYITSSPFFPLSSNPVLRCPSASYPNSLSLSEAGMSVENTEATSGAKPTRAHPMRDGHDPSRFRFSTCLVSLISPCAHLDLPSCLAGPASFKEGGTVVVPLASSSSSTGLKKSRISRSLHFFPFLSDFLVKTTLPPNSRPRCGSASAILVLVPMGCIAPSQNKRAPHVPHYTVEGRALRSPPRGGVLGPEGLFICFIFRPCLSDLRPSVLVSFFWAVMDGACKG